MSSVSNLTIFNYNEFLNNKLIQDITEEIEETEQKNISKEELVIKDIDLEKKEIEINNDNEQEKDKKVELDKKDIDRKVKFISKSKHTKYDKTSKTYNTSTKSNIEDDSLKCFNDQKYKCPRCRIQYCSVSCYKIHSTICKTVITAPIVVEEKIKTDILLNDEDEDDSRLQNSQLQTLKKWPGLKNWVSKAVNGIPISKIIVSIDSSKNPIDLLTTYMKDPTFSAMMHEMLTYIGARTKESSLAPIYNMDYISSLAAADAEYNEESFKLPMKHDPTDIRYLDEYFQFKEQKRCELEALYANNNL